MGVDTKAILRKGTTLEQIKNRIELKYGEVSIRSTHSEDYFEIIFKEPKEIPGAATHRSLAVFINDFAKNDYGIDGVLVSLGYWGSNIEIMKWLLEEFGGYLDESDCDDEPFYPVNLYNFKKGRELTKEEQFTHRVISILGYENLKPTLQLFEEYKTL